MKTRIFSTATLIAFIAATAVGGVGAWTTNPPSGPGFQVATDSGLPGVVYTELARSGDNGLTWQSYGLDSFRPVVIAAGTPGTAYVSGQLNGNTAVVLATSDAGLHWTVVTSRSNPAPLLLEWCSYILADSRTPGVVYAQFNQQTEQGTSSLTIATLEKSTDGGKTWTTTGFPQNGSGFDVISMAIDPGNPSTLLAADFAPDTGYLGFRSSDGGATWESVPTSTGVNQFAFDPHVAGNVFAVALYHLLKSTDGGVTFAPVNTDLIPITQVVMSPTTPGRVFALSNLSVFTSSDWGLSFTPLNAGPPNLLLNGPAIDSTGRYLHASTSAGMVYDYQLNDLPVLNPSHPFSVSLTASDPRTGRVGAGVGTQVNDLWAYFSIPEITGNANNPEVFVKVLDGTAINGAYWFFYGGLTDLEYTLTVTEISTGRQKTYSKPGGSECGGSDTAAFTP